MTPVFTTCCSFMCRKIDDNLNSPELRDAQFETNPTDTHQIAMGDIAGRSTDFQMIIFTTIARDVVKIVVLAPPIGNSLLDVHSVRWLGRDFLRRGHLCLRWRKTGHRWNCHWWNKGCAVLGLACTDSSCCVRIDRQSRWFKCRTTFSFSLLIVFHVQRLNQISNC